MNTQQLTDSYEGALSTSGSKNDNLNVHGTYYVECHDSNGVLKWDDKIENLITTAGLKHNNDTILGGSATAGAALLGLKGTGTAAAADTQASHAGWLEVGLNNAPEYNIAASVVRGSPSFGASTNASPSVKATSAAVVFTIVTGGTVAGAFINLGGTTTIENTTGILFSVGDFTAGSKVVTTGDTLSVSYILNAQ